MSQRVALILAVLLTVTAAGAQTQSPAQRKCLAGTDKITAAIVNAQWKAAGKCLSSAAGEKLLPGQSAAQCLIADNGGKVAKVITKAAAAEAKLCNEELPSFGHTATATLATAAVAGARAAFADLFGDDLGAAVITSDSNKDGARCQSTVAKASGKLLRSTLAEFLSCKAAGLKDASIASTADLDRCFDAIDTDARGKIASAAAKLASLREPSECSSVLFPGVCAGAVDSDGCVENASRCRTCEILTAANQLSHDCDQFDDALLNLSCGSCADADCDVNATCTSTGAVSYDCTCNSGYSGDGTGCEAIDSCLTDNGGCDANATCTPTGPNTNSCACNSGYSGDGTSCEAIDACLTDNGGCDSHATCTSTGPGTNSCECNSAYTGDGYTCSCTPVLDPPTLNGGYITLKRIRLSNGQVFINNVTSPLVPSDQTLDNFRSAPIELNAGAFIDPAACNGELLQFHWTITTDEVPGDYRVAGITGYDSSILAIDQNSLIGGGTQYTFRLVVTSTASPTMPTRSTTYIIEALSQGSQANYDIFHACQDGTPATHCDIPNLLPPGVQAE